MDCSCPSNEIISKQIHKLENELSEMSGTARRLLKNASDPFSAVIRFLYERPENVLLNGLLVKTVLIDVFGGHEQIPGLLQVLSAHLRDVVRQANVIAIYNEHFSQVTWAGYLIKVKEQIKFEVARDRDKLLLKNIAGLICVEHGVDLPLDSIRVNPPKLEITVKLGLLRPVRAVDILS